VCLRALLQREECKSDDKEDACAAVESMSNLLLKLLEDISADVRAEAKAAYQTLLR
jgi:hypothetical protein